MGLLSQTVQQDRPILPRPFLSPAEGSPSVLDINGGRVAAIEFADLELNPEYVSMSERRITNDAPLFNAKPVTEQNLEAETSPEADKI